MQGPSFPLSTQTSEWTMAKKGLMTLMGAGRVVKRKQLEICYSITYLAASILQG